MRDDRAGRARDYLMGQMPEEESALFEKEFFSDDDLLHTLHAAEDDLVDAYVRNRLAPAERRSFEERYLVSAERRNKVEFARAFLGSLSELGAATDLPLTAAEDQERTLPYPAEPRQASRRRLGWLRPLAIGAVATAIAIIVIWALSKRSLPGPGEQPQIASVSFSLEPGVTRSKLGTEVSIAAGIKQVEFHLALSGPGGNENYRAVLNTPEKAGLWSGAASATADTAVVAIPAQALPHGDYTLELQVKRDSQWEKVATYAFRVRE